MRPFLIRPHLYVAVSIIGLCLKFYHLDHKLLWIDEIYTIQHTSGIADKDYPTLVPLNDIKDVGFYCDLYRLNSHRYNVGEQLMALCRSPQLNPLHYPLLMGWYRLVGDDPFAFRLFSVFAFIITLPGLFVLSRKLFESDLAGWIAVSLYACSPYFHLFAQEARYYILWAFTLVTSHALFLQAIHRNKARWWIVYAFVAAISLYASPVSIVIVVGHLAFLGLTRADLLRKGLLSFSLALFLYTPWALSLFFRFDAIASGLSWHSAGQNVVPLWLPVLGQALYVQSIFTFPIDYLTAFDATSVADPAGAATTLVLTLPVLVIVGGAFVALFTRASKQVRNFLLLTVLPGFILFFLYDVLRDARTSWWWRYLMFVGPGIILVMTSFLFKGIAEGRLGHALGFVGLAIAGLSSIVILSEARHWHIGNKMNTYLGDARLIAECERPLLITDLPDNRRMVDFMVVLHECRSHDIDILRASPSGEGVEDGCRPGTGTEYSDVFVLYSSEEFTDRLQARLGRRMKKLEREGISYTWRIRVDGMDPAADR